MNVVNELVRIAKSLMFDEEHVFLMDEANDAVMNRIVHDFGAKVDKLARRYKTQYRLGTRVNGRALELSIGVDESPNKEKMLRSAEKAAKAVGFEYKVRVI